MREIGRRLINSVIIGTKSDLLFTPQLTDVINMVNDRIRIRLSIGREEIRIEIHPDISSALYHGSELMIRQISEMIAQGAAAAV